MAPAVAGKKAAGEIPWQTLWQYALAKNFATHGISPGQPRL
jgi:hypothetical protein